MTDLEKIRAKYGLQVKPKTIDVEVEIVTRKKVAVAAPVPKKEYYVIAYEDLVFWVANANRPIFSDALAQYTKLKKRGTPLEIRWYWDKIEIH